MKYTTIDHEPGDPRTALTAEQILALSARELHPSFVIDNVCELAGGTINSTFLIESMQGTKVILRVAPMDPIDPFWNQPHLMRREYQIQPYFAAIADKMPRILSADFTHQIITRDYMFQHYLVGERWDQIEGELSARENDMLWQQFGQILKTVHTTRGENFGWPSPGRRYDTWRQLVIDQLETIMQDLRLRQLDHEDFATLLQLVSKNGALLDEISEPRLLHGDLWTFNLLVQRDDKDIPRISGVLDAERAWWGDPLADWTMFIWAKGDGATMPRAQSMFWAGYGQPDQRWTTRFRQEVYNAMFLGRLLLLSHKNGAEDGIERAGRELRETNQALSTITEQMSKEVLC